MSFAFIQRIVNLPLRRKVAKGAKKNTLALCVDTSIYRNNFNSQFQHLQEASNSSIIRR
jgi:hypothetical protein